MRQCRADTRSTGSTPSLGWYGGWADGELDGPLGKVTDGSVKRHYVNLPHRHPSRWRKSRPASNCAIHRRLLHSRLLSVGSAPGRLLVSENPDFRNLAEPLLPRARIESEFPEVVVPVTSRVTAGRRFTGAVLQQMAA